MQRVTVEISAEQSGRQKSVWFVLETPHNSYDEVAQALTRDGVVTGWRIDVAALENGGRRERRRSRVTVGKAGLTIMQEIHFNLLPALLPDAEGRP